VKQLLLILLLAVSLVALLVLPLPTFDSALWAAIENAAHAPLFGAIALLVVEWLQRRQTRHTLSSVGLYGCAFLASVALGFLTELVQFFGPRDASVDDLVTNTLGVIAALSAHAALCVAPDRRDRLALTAAAALSVLAVLAPIAAAVAARIERGRQFPVLADFDSRLDTHHVRGIKARFERVTWPEAYAKPGDGPALRVEFLTPGGSGVIFDEPARDWSAHRELVLDLANPQPHAVELLVRVDDALHDKRREDRFERIVPLAPQQRAEIRIALASIRQTPSGRHIDLARISAIMLFNSNGRANERLYLGSIRLE